MGAIILILSILLFLRNAYCSDDTNVKVNTNSPDKKGSEMLEQQDAWESYEKNIPLGLMLSKREAHKHSKNPRKYFLNKETPRINISLKKDFRSKNDFKDVCLGKLHEYSYFDSKNVLSRALLKKSKCLPYCFCKRRLSKKKMKKVMALIKEAMKTFDDPPPKPKPLAPPCHLGTCCMPCSQDSRGCCCPCTQMVKVKYHPPQFEFEAMKGALMCGCGFGHPCGGCLMKSG